MTTMNTQVGVKDEVSYGTAVTVDRFFEFNSESVEKEMGRVESKGLRSGTRTLRSDRWEPYVVGAGGDLEIDVPTKGFGWWLKHMLGTVATTGPTDANYTHTGTEGSLLGDHFTFQVNRPFNPAGTNQAFTYSGGKVTKWELGCDVDGVLVAKLSLDFRDETTATGLAVASYPTDFRVFSFAGASFTLGGSAVCLENFSVSGDNALNVGARYMCADPLKHEPKEDGMRTYEFSATAEFADLSQYNRFVSSTRAGALAAVVATFNGPIAHGGTTLPQVLVTIPAARFDAVDGFQVSGPEALKQDIAGVCLFDGTNSPVSIAYRTTDATA